MAKEIDRISECFRGRTIFITGATGFIGKPLVEKILRCCEVKKLYLLIRSKRGKTPQQRLNDLFKNVLFEEVKKQKPEATKKCQIIAGDLSEEYLGISPEDRIILQNEVEFIYHSGASTLFGLSVRVAVTVNTRSTKYLLDLAQKCKNLKIFVHISTAYAFPEEEVLYEKAYKPPQDAHRVLEICQFDSEEACEALLGKSPNTYTFSKALAEALVVEQLDKLPVIVTRPSIVCPMYEDPLPGWCNNLQGPAGLFVGAGKGIIRSVYLKPKYSANFVPVDSVVNGLMISTWNFLKNSKSVRIFNLTSPEKYTYTWEHLIETGRQICYNEVPFNWVAWYPGGSPKESKFLHYICFYLFQILPALLIDAILLICFQKPILYSIQRRIETGLKLFEYYVTREWNFVHDEGSQIIAKLNKTERQRYKMEEDNFDLHAYLVKSILFVRRHILKETDDTLPTAKRHLMVMWIVDIVCKLVFVLALLHYVFKWVLKPIFEM